MLVFFELGLQKCIVMADPFETRFAAQRDIVSVPPTAMQCARGRPGCCKSIASTDVRVRDTGDEPTAGLGLSAPMTLQLGP
jgi:hypothetical protein